MGVEGSHAPEGPRVESSAVPRLLLGPHYVEGQWLLRVKKHTAKGVAEFQLTDLGLLSVRCGDTGYLGVTVATDEFLRSKPEKKAVPFVGHQRDVALGWFRKL